MTDRENTIKWQSYFYPGTNVLINYMGIKDHDLLKEFEATYSFYRLMELRERDIFMPTDKNRLNAIHKYLFEDVYPFAGKYRIVNLVKQRGLFFSIDKPEDIDNELNKLFEEINERISKCYDKWDFCKILARLYTALIFIHPYREGNGRTIREFLREYSLVMSDKIGIGRMELEWSEINKEQLDEYIDVVHLFPNSIATIFEAALIDVNKIKK